ncbi:MAG: hypothetical protein ABJG41_14880 [Cyclobacteriaceae bacterium]
MKKSENHNPEIDYLAPTSLEKHQPVLGPFTSFNLSHHEADKKLELLNKVVKSPHLSFRLQRLKKDYHQHLQKHQQTRLIQHINHASGQRIGLSQQNHSGIKDQHDHVEQSFRNQLMHRAKLLYKRDSLSSRFKTRQKHIKNLFTALRSKTMDKDR